VPLPQPTTADAIHPSSSYTRTTTNTRLILKHDFDDDGEDAAGSRLAHLLMLRNETGVLIVVSRWFGGIHLGPKRFAHISNVARALLVMSHPSTLGDDDEPARTEVCGGKHRRRR
jgi:hypothetical protein